MNEGYGICENNIFEQQMKIKDSRVLCVVGSCLEKTDVNDGIANEVKTK